MDFPGWDSLVVQVCAVLGTRVLDHSVGFAVLYPFNFGQPGLRMRLNNLSSLYPRFVTDPYSVPSVGLTRHYTVYSASSRLQPPIQFQYNSRPAAHQLNDDAQPQAA